MMVNNFFFKNLIIWMSSNEVMAILDKILSGGGGMSFFPYKFGFKELNYCGGDAFEFCSINSKYSITP